MKINVSDRVLIKIIKLKVREVIMLYFILIMLHYTFD